MTISTSGVPARLKSTSVALAPEMRPSAVPRWTFFAASSSRCARTIPTSLSSSPGTTSRPSRHSGSSYWEIWYAFGLSG